MKTNRTFTIIKPDAVAVGNAGAILDRIIKNGYKVVALKYLHMNTGQAGAFYAVHKERPFYNDLVQFMSSGPVYVAILEKADAVASYRKFIGATNPKDAAAGTLRAEFAQSVQMNAVHGSDSDENACIEGNFFFSELEMVH